MFDYKKTILKSSFFIIYILAFLLSACQEKKKETANNSTQEIEITSEKAEERKLAFIDSAIYLESIYATSTSLPFAEYSIQNAFDNDPNTIWQTMKGTAPDEGIMIEPVYYKEALPYLESLTIHQAEGDNFAQIKTVTIYLNGKNKGSFDATQVIPIQENIETLFIRITETSGISSKEIDTVSKINTFDENLNVGIKDIEFLGQKISQGTDEGRQVKIKFLAPNFVKGKITPSSTLEPTFAYKAAHLFDARKDIAWAEGVENNGVGTTINFKLEKSQKLTHIQLWNGYQRSEKHFEANARIKKFSFGTTENQQEYELKDELIPQKIELIAPLEGDEFVLEIKEVFEGTKYKDLVLSEFRLYDGIANPIFIQDQSVENQILDIKKQAQNTPLENILDRRINYQEDDYFQIDKSFLLRSDGTFVMYKNQSSKEEDSKSEILADGNWEIKKIEADKVRIRVFGKFVDFSEYQDFYKGKITKDLIQIFQDFIVIDNEKLKGEKFVGEFKMK